MQQFFSLKNIKLLFLYITFYFFIFSFSFAQQINLIDKNGKVVERIDFKTGIGTGGRQANERMKLFWTCWTKKIFNSLYCDFASLNLPNTQREAVEVFTPELQEDIELPMEVSSAQPSANANGEGIYSQQVVYQVIERAVPGPQGPAGRDGKDGISANTNNNQFLSSYPSSPTYSGQYNGFGIQSSNANPTGDASLATISGTGLSSCNSTTSKILYNSSTKMFECGTDLNTGGSVSGSDIVAQNIFATTTLKSPNIYASTTNATTSNSVNINSTNINATNATITNSTSTNLFVSNASLTFATSTYIFSNTILGNYLSSTNSTLTNSTSTHIYSTNASVTNSTSTNFFSVALTSLLTNITDLLFTNATGTNATTTNFATNYFNAMGISIIPNLFGTNATFTNATITNISNTNFTGNLATLTSATTTNIYSQNASFTNLVSNLATFSYATVTNGFFTNLSVTGPVQAALTNGYIFRGGTNNYSEATSTVFVSNSGLVGVGSTTPTEKLSVQGNVLISGNIVRPKFSNLPVAAGGDSLLCIDGSGNVKTDSSQDCFNTYSDQNLKKNVVNVTSTLDRVKSLNTVNFNWIDVNRGTSTQLGYIAQDVEKVFPEVVKKDENGFLKVNYISLSAIYANAIKELDTLVFARISEIIDRLSKNEVDILNLKTRVSDLESRLGSPTASTPVSIPIPPANDTTIPIENNNENNTETQVETGASDSTSIQAQE